MQEERHRLQVEEHRQKDVMSLKLQTHDSTSETHTEQHKSTHRTQLEVCVLSTSLHVLFILAALLLVGFVFVVQQGVPLSLTANFDLRSHVEALGHNVSGCMGVNLSSRRCGGFLTKRGGRVKTWRRRWFIFDLDHQRLAYYTGENVRLH